MPTTFCGDLAAILRRLQPGPDPGFCQYDDKLGLVLRLGEVAPWSNTHPLSHSVYAPTTCAVLSPVLERVVLCQRSPVTGWGDGGQPGVPHKRWVCIDLEDLEEPSATCEMCEVKLIRYVHHMHYPTYPDLLSCGCVCAGHMEQDYEGARQREKVLRNSATRKRKWLTFAWRTSKNGNPYLDAEGVQRRGLSVRIGLGLPGDRAFPADAKVKP